MVLSKTCTKVESSLVFMYIISVQSAFFRRGPFLKIFLNTIASIFLHSCNVRYDPLRPIQWVHFGTIRDHWPHNPFLNARTLQYGQLLENVFHHTVILAFLPHKDLKSLKSKLEISISTDLHIFVVYISYNLFLNLCKRNKG